MPFTGSEFLPTKRSIVLDNNPSSVTSSASPVSRDLYQPNLSTALAQFSTYCNTDFAKHQTTPSLVATNIHSYSHISMSPVTAQLPIVALVNNEMSKQQIDEAVPTTYCPVSTPQLGDQSTVIRCPHCLQVQKTYIVRQVGATNVLASVLACVCLPCSWLGCQCIPLCVEDWKDAVHYCSICGRKLGSYNALASNQQTIN